MKDAIQEKFFGIGRNLTVCWGDEDGNALCWMCYSQDCLTAVQPNSLMSLKNKNLKEGDKWHCMYRKTYYISPV